MKKFATIIIAIAIILGIGTFAKNAYEKYQYQEIKTEDIMRICKTWPNIDNGELSDLRESAEKVGKAVLVNNSFGHPEIRIVDRDYYIKVMSAVLTEED